MTTSFIRQGIIFSAIAFLSSCTSPSTDFGGGSGINYGAPSGVHGSVGWNQYIHSSPFSYSHDSSPRMVAMLGREISGIPVQQLDGDMAAHIRKVAAWAEDYPSYADRAAKAGAAAYAGAKRWERESRFVGEHVGSSLADDDRMSQFFGRNLGELFGWWANEAYAEHRKNAEFWRIMHPIMIRGKQLAIEEDAINARLDKVSTNHLQRIIGQLR